VELYEGAAEEGLRTMTRRIGVIAFMAALAATAAPAAAAKPIWSCQFAKDRVLMAASFEPDPAAPAQPPGKQLTLKGNLQLVLSQTFYAPGQPLKDTRDGTYSFKGYIVDNGAALVFGPERAIPSTEWLADRREASGRWSGMFLNRPVSDGIGRPLSTDFSDLTSAAPPDYLNFRFGLPPSFYETARFFARVPTDGFKALHAKGLARAAATQSATLAKC